MSDYWAWVEPDEAPLPELGIKPVFGHVTGRNFFPPDYPHPSVSFQRFDPDSPTAFTPPNPQDYSPLFGDFSAWAGWNGPMDRSAAINTTDTTSAGTVSGLVGQTARMTVIDTSSDDLRDWHLLPGHYDMTGLNPRVTRFIPFTNIIAMLVTESGITKLIGIDTDTLTRIMEVTALELTGDNADILTYNYSYDGKRIAVTFDTTDKGTWIFRRSDIFPGTVITATNVFGTTYPSDVHYTDDSNFLFIWGIPSNNMEVYSADAPYTKQEVMNPGMGMGLFGPTPYGTNGATIHNRNLFFQLAGEISLGLGGLNTTTPIFNEDLVKVVNAGGSEEGSLIGDWSAAGDCWIGTDGGRDPYGGVISLVRTAYLQTQTGLSGSGGSPQEWGDIRCRPYH